jgi:signal transduction histidine kinase
MRIRSRITLTFTAFFGVTTIALCTTIYFLSASSIKDLFYSQLTERIDVAENFFLESENRDEKSLDEIRKKFLRTLPEELEFYSELSGFSSGLPDSIQKVLPENFLDQVSNIDYTYWSSGKQQGIAKVYAPYGTEYVVLVVAEDTYGNEYLHRLRILLISVTSLSLILSYLLSNYFSRNVLKPIASKIKKANQISAKNLDLRLTVYNENDELGMLGKSFNDLLDRLQASFELQKNFVRYASHEMKNPLAIMIGEAEVSLSQVRTPNEYALTIDKLKRSAEKLNNLVEFFLELSKYDKVQLDLKPVQLDELLMNIIIQISSALDSTVEIKFSISEELEPDDLIVQADKTLLNNALLNLIENAVKFSQDNGTVYLELKYHNAKDKIELTIIDKGMGIPEEDLHRIFEPLFRSGNALNTSGSGIGLAIVEKILNLHQFNISVQSTVNVGTTIKVVF